MEIIYAAAPAMVSGVTLLIVGWTARRISTFIKRFDEEHKTLMESNRNQLKASIVDRYENATERGYITCIELETANRMYDSYKQLGGNHYVKALMGQMNSMEARGDIPHD